MKRLLLLGGGHAHLFVLEELARGALGGADTTLVSATRRQVYSGMVPGMIGGRYRLAELSFDLPLICRRAGVRFVHDSAVRIRAADRRVELNAGGDLDYDVLSVATGSTVQGSDLPGVRDHAFTVRPIDRATELTQALERAAAEGGRISAVVVGGGAAGVEIALAVRSRLAKLGGPGRAAVTLVEAAPGLLGGGAARAEAVVRHALQQHGVALRLGTAVAEVTRSAVRLEGRDELPASLVVWATGAAATDLLRTSGLGRDERGFLLVDNRLRSVSDAAVFAAGDAATLSSYPATPRAGVYAVREGPVLRANLAAACRGEEPPRAYRPQRRFLSLLNTSDGRAIVSYGRLATWSRWGMWLKDGIDRRFVRRFQALER
ncbi:MAG TPA: FAD-dependent oxidoreductase [Gemmatimonadales bacterium]|nr:FAD-dependent oxidoreductase [Gemmatimonadales bacterium]